MSSWDTYMIVCIQATYAGMIVMLAGALGFFGGIIYGMFGGGQ